jgi:hypothetical protein
MVYVNDSKWVIDPTRVTGRDAGWHMDYIVDSVADVAKLPKMDVIMGGSTAVIRPTKQILFLGENGWEP